MKERARAVRSGSETDEAADRLANTSSIDSNGFDKKAKPQPSNPPGPSLHTQIAPSHSGAMVSSSNTGLSSTSIAPSASTTATSVVRRPDSEVDHDLLHSKLISDEKNIWFFWHTGYTHMHLYTQRNIHAWHSPSKAE